MNYHWIVNTETCDPVGIFGRLLLWNHSDGANTWITYCKHNTDNDTSNWVVEPVLITEQTNDSPKYFVMDHKENN